MERPFIEFDSRTDRVLHRVSMFADADLPEIVSFIELDFHSWRVFVCVNSEWDTLLCANDLPQSVGMRSSVSLSAEFWRSILGHTLVNAWLMTSAKGGTDALQLRFRHDANHGSLTIIQIDAVAAGLHLTELSLSRESRWIPPKPPDQLG